MVTFCAYLPTEQCHMGRPLMKKYFSLPKGPKACPSHTGVAMAFVHT